MATCTSQASIMHPLNLWDTNDAWDCANYPTAADDVILSNAAPIIVNGAEAAASIQWETLTGSRSFEIGPGKSLTISGAVNLNGTATYSVSFTGTGTFSPATTVYYCSSSTVTGITCEAGGPPGPGYGSKPAPGSTINFSGAVGSTPTQSLVVSETGGATLTISTMALSGANVSKFDVTTPASFSITDGGAPQTVNLTCDGSSAGTFTASLSVLYGASGSPATYPLSCVIGGGGGGGTPPPVGASVESGLALTLTFLGIVVIAAFKMRKTNKA